MPLNRPTIDVIYNRIKADMELRLTNNLKLPRYSLLSILAKIFAMAIHLCYGVLVWLSNQLFPDTADEDYLTRHGAMKDISQKPATFAEGSILITGVAGTVVPVGTQWVDENDNLFLTTVEETIPVSAEIETVVEAAVAGSASNGLGTATTMSIVVPIVNVDSVANITVPPSGGVEAESTEDFRARIIFAWQNPPSGGREADYIQWATEVAGVGKAWVFDTINGVGTVGTVIASPDNEAVSTPVFDDADLSIQTQKPIGIVHTTINLQSEPIDYVIDIPANSSETLKDSIIDELQNMHDNIGAPGGTITLSNINTAITSAGLSNYKIVNIYVNAVAIGVNDIVMTGVTYPDRRNVNFGTL